MKNQLNLFFALILIIFSSCGKSDPVPEAPTLPTLGTSDKAITKFLFTKADNPALLADAEGIINGTTIKVTVYGGTKTSLKPTITHTGKSINYSNTLQDFTSPVTYAITSYNGSTVNYTVEVQNSDVYVVGNEIDATTQKYKIAYWKNGVKNLLTNGSTDARGYGIAVVGNDVYVAGMVNLSNGTLSAAYWKNGIKTPLSELTTTSALVSHMIVVGTDVYVVGQLGNSAVYWKNGVMTTLANSGSFAFGNSLFINGSDLYILGESGIGATASYWKNGVKTDLSDGTNIASVRAMSVIGSDHYFIGENSGNAAYWKNGVKTDLAKGSAWSSTVDGNDLYIAGVDMNNGKNIASYWRNGTLVRLGDGVNTTTALSIATAGRDIFVAGNEIINSITQATLWMNGKQITLSDTKSFARHVIVK